MEKESRIVKIAIVVLAILLALSLIAFGIVMLIGHRAPGQSATAVIPSNVITDQPSGTTVSAEPTVPEGTVAPEETATPSETTASEETAAPAEQTTAPEETAASIQTDSPVPERVETTISLYRTNAQESVPFEMPNMFPGDSATKVYKVKVSYQDEVTLRFFVDIEPGSEKLAEVLMCRIELLTEDKVLYDGLMRDLPEEIAHPLKSSEATEAELHYEVTVWMDTSAGNEYMNQKLEAGFLWWVAEEDNLQPPTGDLSNLALWGTLLAVSVIFFLLILLLFKRRKKEEEQYG